MAPHGYLGEGTTVARAAKPELVDASLAEARVLGRLPDDMPAWMATVIDLIDGLNKWVAYAVCWLMLPLMLAMVYEVVVRKVFTAPTIWAYDVNCMLYGAHFMLGSAYAL
jgi:hypothetical protein